VTSAVLRPVSVLSWRMLDMFEHGPPGCTRCVVYIGTFDIAVIAAKEPANVSSERAPISA
jgi:hypothetical protein